MGRHLTRVVDGGSSVERLGRLADSLSIALGGAFAAYLVVQGDLFELAFVVGGVTVMFIGTRVQSAARRTITRGVQGAARTPRRGCGARRRAPRSRLRPPAPTAG
jgi:hypothetical protein